MLTAVHIVLLLPVTVKSKISLIAIVFVVTTITNKIILVKNSTYTEVKAYMLKRLDW